MGEGLATALDEAASAAEDGAREQRRVAAIARRAAHRERESPGEPGTAARAQSVLTALGASAERLAASVGGLRRALVRAFAESGMSVRQIADRLGVSHQRVSVLLSRARPGARSDAVGRGQ